MEINAEAVVGAIAANPILGVIILLCLGATVVNGATDAPNAIATVVGTRAMRPGPAIIMAAACNFIGMVLITVIRITKESICGLRGRRKVSVSRSLHM